MTHLFHWHPPLRTGLQVPQKIHRESSPSYGAIPYYTWVLPSGVPSICSSKGCWKCLVESHQLACPPREAENLPTSPSQELRDLKWGVGCQLEEGITTSRGK